MRAVLDACVLYPTVLREILTGSAQAGLFQPVWSQRILDEWRHAADRHGIPAGVEIALLTDRFPQAMTAPQAVLGLDLPDPADLHVVEAALGADATVIVTANLRDFPARALAQLGLRAIHPDEFLRDFHISHPDAVQDAVTATLARAVQAGGAITRKELMRRARLPRLAKAIERFDKAGVEPERGSGKGRP